MTANPIVDDMIVTTCHEMLEVQYEIGKFIFQDSIIAHDTTAESRLAHALHNSRGTEILRRVLLLRTTVEHLLRVAHHFGVAVDSERLIASLNFLIHEAKRVEPLLRSSPTLQMLFSTIHG